MGDPEASNLRVPTGRSNVSHEHHDVVVEDSGGGLGSGLVLGIIIAALIVIVAIWYFGFGPAQQTQDVNIDVNVPSVPAPSG